MIFSPLCRFAPLSLMGVVLGFGMPGFAKVVPYATPSLGPLSSIYSLSVAAVDVPVYAFQRNGDTPDYYFAHFSFGGKVRITLQVHQPFSEATVSPLALAIRPSIKGDTISFSLRRSRYLIVKVGGLKELVIAADPLETDVPPAEGKNTFNVLSYGADKTGTEKSTDAFSKALSDAAAAKGQATVYVPDGLYVVGNVVLPSNVTLYLSGGAVMQASKDASDFTKNFVVGSPGNHGTKPENGTWFVSTAPRASNVTIRGRGVIDGSGSYLTDPQHGYLLDDLIVPLGASNVTIDGIVGWDAGFWALTPDRSNHVKIVNYKGMQSLQTYQNDGIDIDEDQDVLIDHSIVVSRDDCYSSKTWGPNGLGKHWPGEPEPVSNVLIHDAVAWTTDGAFKVGQGDFESHSHVTVDTGYVYRAHWAIYLKPNLPASEAAAPVSDITYKNIDVEAPPFTRDHKKFTWLYIELPFASLTDLNISHINVRTKDTVPAITTADHGSIHGFHLDHVVVGGTKLRSFADMGVNMSGVTLSDATFNGRPAR